MGREHFLNQLRLIRRDLGDLLFHFTREVSEPGHPNPFHCVVTASAFEVLRKILRERQLLGGLGYIKGTTPCVCFSEAPIAELVNLFRLASSSLRYRPYGVAVQRSWLFNQGGRPAIYQPAADYERLDPSIQWRHSTFEPPYKDFTWEREWRIARDRLVLEPQNTLVVVPSSAESQLLAAEFNEPGSKPAWSFVSLELLGFAHEEPAV